MKQLGAAICILTLISGCVSIDGVSKDAALRVVPPITVEADEALVNFYHPTTLEDLPVPLSISPIPGVTGLPTFFKASNAYQIWKDDQLVGFLPVSNRCLQVRIKPGKQIFLGRFVRSNAGNWNVLQGDFEGGKTYFVKVVQRWNTWKPSVAFQVLKPTEPEFGNIDACKAPISYDHTSDSSASFWRDHVSTNIVGVRGALRDLKNGSQNVYVDPVIQPSDGR